MSRITKVDANVVDDTLLLEGVFAERELSAEAVAKGESKEDANLLDLAQKVDKLVLSFKKIVKIENLNGFSSLTTLKLDNNNIEDIVNLGHLTNLTWLDLSFNKIRKIQGLESLVNLQDLTLYSNKISYVEGLGTLKKLQCLSLGNNRIDSLEQIINLRGIRTMKMLNLAGNPICAEPEYKMVTLAYVDSLQYLDYALIQSAEYELAKEQYHDELLDVEEKESVVAERSLRDKQLEVHLEKLSKACILFAHVIIDDLLASDEDLERLKHLPGIKEAIDGFQASFKVLSEEYVAVGLEKYHKKSKEIEDFESSITKLRANAESESTQLIASFTKSRKNIAAVLTSPESNYTQADSAQMVKKLLDDLDKTCDTLMTLELRLVEKFDMLVDEFDNRLMEMKNVAIEGQQVFFRGLEELEDKFSGNVRAVVQDLIDRLASEELPEDYVDDEAMGLLADKDSCMGLVGASHDAHIGKIMKREDEARNLESRRYQETVSGHVSGERSRNRDRVLQIHSFSKANKQLVNNLLVVDEDDVDFDRE